MKQKLIIFILLLQAFVFALEQQGTFVNVELLSGTKQRAQFLGIVNDTVRLGGYIKNKFTEVHIVKNQFKSIVDEQGNDLLNANPEVQTSTQTNTQPQDSTVTPDVSDSVQTDSIVNKSDSTQNTTEVQISDSTTTADSSISTSEQVEDTPKLSPIFIAYDPIFSDSILTLSLNFITSQLMHEHGYPVKTIKRASVIDCTDDICIQNKLHSLGVDTLYFGKISKGPNDSITITLTQVLFEEDLPTIHKGQVILSEQSVLTDAFNKNKLTNFILETLGKEIKVEHERKSYIHVETDPEGATLSRSEASAICRTPCTFATQDTDKVEINAYWNVDTHMWGARATVRPIPGDTAKISMKLKRIKPEIHIVTNPTNAEIFKASEPITKKSKALGTTPSTFNIFEPGVGSFILRKVGYRDTLVTFYMAPTTDTHLNIDLQEQTNINELSVQKEWEHDRKMLQIGRMLMGLSIAPVAVGALFAYLAQKDYNKAEDLKDELSMPASISGEYYQQKIQENKDYVDKGDKKNIIAGSLVSTGLIFFGVGLFFTF